MTARLFALHGLTVESDLELPAQRSLAEPDLTLKTETGPVPATNAPGRLCARLQLGGFTYSISSVAPPEAMVRFHGSCEFNRTDLRSVQGLVSAAVKNDLAATLFSNATLAAFLEFDGCHMIHASAVSIDGKGLAFAGPSLSGKTTIAAALCTLGGQLISDDTLRIEASAGEVWCFPGTNRLRLRANAKELANQLPRQQIHSSDGRMELMEPQPASTQPLSVLLLPARASGSNFELQKLRGSERLAAMLTCTRIGGWMPSIMAPRLQKLAALASTLRMFRLHVPTGALWHATGRLELLSTIGKALR